MKSLIVVFFTMINIISVLKAQNASLSVGTDIPYQFYVGGNYETDRLLISFRTGVLTPPYSDLALDIMEELGTDPLLVSLLENTFQVGWMNSVGGYYKFGRERQWYAGLEFRADLLTASSTSAELLESATGQTVGNGNRPRRELDVNMGLILYAAGVRVGRTIALDKQQKSQLDFSLSFAKHLESQTLLTIQGEPSERVNSVLDSLLWNEVFRDYGFLGGLGIAYTYRF